MPQCYNTSLADHAHTEGNKSELFPWIRDNNHLSCKQQQQQVGTWRNNYTVLPHGNLAEVRCSWRHIHRIPSTKMAAHGPFLGRLSNPVSPHVFSLIHVRCGLVVELEHTGPHASENHLSVPLEHHLSTPISTASHSGCWVGAALLLAAAAVVVVEYVCVCVCVCVCGGGDGELAGLLFLLLPLPILTAQTNMQYTHATRNFTR